MVRSGDRQPRALWMVVAVAAVVNFAFLVPGFGEQDAARNWSDVVVWAKSGALTGADYRVKVLPLYLILSRALYDLTGDAASTIAILGYLSAAAATIVLLPLYVIWQRLTDATVALAAVVVVNFIPAFWVGHLYAFPHVIAVLFFTVAVACLTRAGDADGPNRWHILTVATAAVAGAFKADIVLCGAALLIVPLLTRQATRVAGLTTGAASIAAMVGVPLLLAALILGPATPHVGAAASDWSGRFPIVPHLFFGIENARLIVRSMGTLFFLLAAVGAVIGLRDARLRPVILLIAAWAAPAVLFWGMRDGNNSRHLMASYVGAAPLIVFALWAIVATARCCGGRCGGRELFHGPADVRCRPSVDPADRIAAFARGTCCRTRAVGKCGRSRPWQSQGSSCLLDATLSDRADAIGRIVDPRPRTHAV